ncbi:MAG TPA: sporulation protein YunB, partial [Limnochordia bacterium]
NALGLTYRWGELNRLQSAAIKAVIAHLEANSFQTVPLPLGELTGLGVLAGMGPRVRITIAAVGGVQADTRFDFRAAGINQVLHSIYLELRVEMRVLAPLVSAQFPIEQRVPLVSVVLQGDVPAVYLNWSGGMEELQRLLSTPSAAGAAKAVMLSR